MKVIFNFVKIIILFICLGFINNAAYAGFSEIPQNFKYKTVLVDHSTILSIGGYNPFSKTMVSAYTYNIKNKKIKELNSFPNIPRMSSNIVKLDSFNFLIFGGYSINQAPTKTAEIYNLKTNTFKKIADSNFEHIAPSVVKLDDNRVFIISFSKVEIFDPKTEKFEIVGTQKSINYGSKNENSLEYYTLNPYTWSNAIKLNDGNVLIIGYFPQKIKNNAEIYNPANNSFTETGTLAHNNKYSALSLLNDGNILVTGGYGDGGKSASIYDIQTGKFIETGKLNQGRNHHCSITLKNGKVLIVGGVNGESETLKFVRLAEVYNPKTGKFQKNGYSKVDREFQTEINLLDNKKVCILGNGKAEIYRY